jgi:hypothetical protein
MYCTCLAWREVSGSQRGANTIVSFVQNQRRLVRLDLRPSASRLAGGGEDLRTARRTRQEARSYIVCAGG